jgi:hypothetical protein
MRGVADMTPGTETADLTASSTGTGTQCPETTRLTTTEGPCSRSLMAVSEIPWESKSDTLATMITDAKAEANKIDSKECLIRSLAAQSQIGGMYFTVNHIPLNISEGLK